MNAPVDLKKHPEDRLAALLDQLEETLTRVEKQRYSPMDHHRHDHKDGNEQP